MTRPHQISTTLAIIVALAAVQADARPPEIRSVNVRGFQIGQPTVVTIDGVDLAPVPKLWLNANAVEAVVDDKQSNANRVVLTATLPNETSPGLAQLRLATADGVSNSVTVAVDRLPQTVFAETIAALPASLHGSVPGSGSSKTSFTGKAGEDLLIEVEAKRLGSKLRPVMQVFDAQRLQIAWALPSPTLAGDARAAIKLPRDGVYTVEVHDLQYAPPGPSFFRLKIGQWQCADLAFPPAVTKGQEVTLALLGGLPGLTVPFRAPADGQIVPVLWPALATASGPPPSILISALPELIEAPPSDPPMPLPAIPFAVSGRLNGLAQQDRFRLAVTPATKLLFEVFAERIGSRIDAVLELRNVQGAVLATMDDGLNTIDPRLEFTVPAGVESLDIVLRDAVDIANDQAIYRLVVTSADAPRFDVDVTAKSDVLNVAAGEMQVLEVNALRRGYDGPLQLALGQLPPGVVVQGTEIPAGASGTLLTLTNTGDAVAPLVTSLVAKSPDGAITRAVSLSTTPDDRSPVWLREQFAVAAAPRNVLPFGVAWADAQPPTNWVLGSKTAIPVTFVRPTGSLGPVRLSLVMSQLEPRVNNQPNAALTVRAERVVEVAIDPPVKAAIDALAALDKQLVDAMKLAEAAQGDAKVAADAKVQEIIPKKVAAEVAARDAESKATLKGELALIVPSVLPESSCDIVVRAELLNPERNIVLRTAYSTVRRLAVLNPISIAFTNAAVAPATFESPIDPKTGAVVKLVGKVNRLADFKGDVNLALTGQPAGVAITNAAVKADQTDFQLELKFPANFAAGEVKGIKLTATGPPDPLSGNQPIKTEIEVVVKLVALPQ